MTNSIELRARIRRDLTKVEARIRHPMTAGDREREEIGGEEAHFIQEVLIEHGDRTVLHALWGPDVARDPILIFQFKGGTAGDIVKLQLQDSKGESLEQQTRIEAA